MKKSLFNAVFALLSLFLLIETPALAKRFIILWDVHVSSYYLAPATTWDEDAFEELYAGMTGCTGSVTSVPQLHMDVQYYDVSGIPMTGAGSTKTHIDATSSSSGIQQAYCTVHSTGDHRAYAKVSPPFGAAYATYMWRASGYGNSVDCNTSHGGNPVTGSASNIFHL